MSKISVEKNPDQGKLTKLGVWQWHSAKRIEQREKDWVMWTEGLECGSLKPYAL